MLSITITDYNYCNWNVHFRHFCILGLIFVRVDSVVKYLLLYRNTCHRVLLVYGQYSLEQLRINTAYRHYAIVMYPLIHTV